MDVGRMPVKADKSPRQDVESPYLTTVSTSQAHFVVCNKEDRSKVHSITTFPYKPAPSLRELYTVSGLDSDLSSKLTTNLCPCMQ